MEVVVLKPTPKYSKTTTVYFSLSLRMSGAKSADGSPIPMPGSSTTVSGPLPIEWTCISPSPTSTIWPTGSILFFLLVNNVACRIVPMRVPTTRMPTKIPNMAMIFLPLFRLGFVTFFNCFDSIEFPTFAYRRQELR